MAFSINGNLITQTGLDTDMSGLATVLNVNDIITYTNNGLSYSIYNLGINRLQIDGTMNQNPDIEMWISNSGSTNTTQAIVVNGNYNAGYRHIENGKTIYSSGILGVQVEHNAYYGKGRGIALNPGGTLNWYGGEFKLGNGIECEMGSFLNIFSTECIYTSTDPDNDMQLKFEGNASDYIIQGLTMNGSIDSISRFFATNGINNAENIIFKRAYVHPRAGAYENPLTLKSISFKNNSASYDVILTGDARFTNTIQDCQPTSLKNIDVGSNIRIAETHDGSDWYGFVEMFHEIDGMLISKTTGNPIQGAIIYVNANNNNDRRNVTGNPIAAEYNSRDFLESSYDNYLLFTDALGNIPLTDILTYVKFRDTVGTQEIFYSKNRINGEDLFDINFWHYNYEYKTIEVPLHGSKKYTLQESLFDDKNLTETNRAVVQGYSEISNLEQLYDYCKNLKMNWITSPSETEQFITANGNVLTIADNWSLIRDNTINNAITIDPTNKNIRVKLATTGLNKTEKYSQIAGSIDSSMDGFTNASYVKSDGKVNFVFDNTNPDIFPLTEDYPSSILYKKNIDTTWSHLTDFTNGYISVGLDPSVDYNIKARVPGYEWKEFDINSGALGGEYNLQLISVKDLDGQPMFTKAYNQNIADMFEYDLINRRITCTNTSGIDTVVDVISSYIKFEKILHHPTIVGEIDDPMTLLPLRDGFKFPSTNTLTIALSNNSNENVYLEYTMKNHDDNYSRNRFIPGTSGYYISFATNVISGLDLSFPTAVENAEATHAEFNDDISIIKSDLITSKSWSEIAAANSQKN